MFDHSMTASHYDKSYQNDKWWFYKWYVMFLSKCRGNKGGCKAWNYWSLAENCCAVRQESDFSATFAVLMCESGNEWKKQHCYQPCWFVPRPIWIPSFFYLTDWRALYLKWCVLFFLPRHLSNWNGIPFGDIFFNKFVPFFFYKQNLMIIKSLIGLFKMTHLR